MRLLFTFIVITNFISVSFSQNTNFVDYHKANRFPNHKSIDALASPYLDRIDIRYYKLDLAVSDQNTYISGSTTIVGQVIETTDTIVFELDDPMVIDSVLLFDTSVAFLHANDLITMPLNTTFLPSDQFDVTVYYHGTPQGSGVSNDAYIPYIYPKVTWTLSESFHAKEWFPCKQVLADKADSVTVWLTVNDDLKAGSNGILKQITALTGGKNRFEWHTAYPINY